MNKKNINLFEAFAGIGSQHEALNNIGINTNIVGLSEWYIDALITYAKYHLNLIPLKINRTETLDFLKEYTLSRNSKNPLKTFSGINDNNLSLLEQIIKKYGELDITKITGNQLINKNIDLFTYSFPCQDLSSQGKQCGFKKENNTRSGLLWEIERILQEMKKIDNTKLPKVLLMENVKALLSEQFRPELDNWQEKLSKLGYINTKPFIINSKNLGEAQSRDRVFMVSILKSENKSEDIIKSFNIGNLEKDLKKYKKIGKISDIYQEELKHDLFNMKNGKITLTHNINKTEKAIKKGHLENFSNFNSEKCFYYLDGLSPTITSTGAQSKIKVWNGEDIVILNGKEHLLLQGFNNNKLYNDMIELGLSDNKVKFLAGNSINVKVLEYIFSKIYK